MKLSRVDIVSIILIIGVLVIAFNIYPTMPERMPTHWNADGEIDGYGNRFVGVFLFPIIIVFVYLVFLMVPYMAVYKKNIESFMKYLEGMKLVMMLFFVSMYVFTLLSNFGIKVNMTYFVIPAIAIMFYYIGYVMQFMKKNYFIGIRTPWTLASDKVWDKTHKLGSITFRVNAVIFLVVLINSHLFVWVIMTTILLNVVLLFGYSYFIWKKEK